MRLLRFLYSHLSRFRRLQVLHADQIRENDQLHLQILELQEEVANLEAEVSYHCQQASDFQKRYRNAIGE